MTGVRVVQEGVAAWTDDDYVVHLLLRPDGPFDLTQTMALAERLAQEALAAVPKETVDVVVEATPAGPVVRLDDPSSVELRLDWMAALVRGLEAAGWSGAVETTTSARLAGRSLDSWFDATGLGVFVSARHHVEHVPGRPFGWGVAEDVTQRLLDAFAGWAQDGADDVVVSHRTFWFRQPAADVAAQLGWGCAQGHYGSAAAASGDVLRYLQLGPAGAVVASVTLGAAGLTATLAAARAALLAAPDETTLGFVRRRTPPPLTWYHVDAAVGGVAPPFASPTEIALSDDRWHDHVPDVHGMQLLAAEHLRRLRSLEGWSVDEVGAGRFLVVADDLQSWYGGASPQADALAAARRQFADVLLVPET